MKIQHKRSAALDGDAAKQPTPEQTEFGELCVNFNSQDPALFIKDNAENIVRVGADVENYYTKEEIEGLDWDTSAADARYLRIDAAAPDQVRLAGTVEFKDNVGIGTDSPAALLQVGATGNSIQLTGADLKFTRNTSYLAHTGTDKLHIRDKDSSDYIIFDYNSGNNRLTLQGKDRIQFDTAGTERMRINSSGNVGIGTDNPATPLHVNTTAATPVVIESSNSQSLINFRNSSTNLFYMGTTNNNWNVQTNSVERLSVTTVGNVGIGTVDPQAKLEIRQDAAGAEGANLVLTNSKQDPNSSVAIYFSPNSASGYVRAAAIKSSNTSAGDTRADLRFMTAAGAPPVERMCITSGGFVGIGTTNPQTNLVIKGSTPQVRLQPTGDTQNCRLEFTIADGSLQSSIQAGGRDADDINFVSQLKNKKTFTVKGSGNVGIGTDNPGTKLVVVDSGDATSTNVAPNEFTANFVTDTAYVNIGSVSGAPCIQGSGTGTSYKLLLNPLQGSVGIGTDNPRAKLDVTAVGEDAEILRLDIERPWSFYQRLTGPSSKLDLCSSSNKIFTVSGYKDGSPDRLEVFYVNTGSGVVGVNGDFTVANVKNADYLGTDSTGKIVAKSGGSNGIMQINAGDGLSGGGTTSPVTLNVDSTVVRTTGNQTLGGTKTFSAKIVGNLQGKADTAGTADVGNKIKRNGITSETDNSYRVLLGENSNTANNSNAYVVTDRSDLYYNPKTRQLAGLASVAANATSANTATNSTNCSRSVVAGNGLTGGGQLNANRTLTVQAADNTITVASGGISVNKANLGIPSVGNGAINVNAGNGLTASGSNATANQSGATTRTLAVQAANNTIAVASGGISVNAGNLSKVPSATNADNATNCSRQIIAGNGLTGGGQLNANRTLTVGAGDGISVATDKVAVNNTVVRTSGDQSISGNKTFNNNISCKGEIYNGTSGNSSTTEDSFKIAKARVNSQSNYDSGSSAYRKIFLIPGNVSRTTETTFATSTTAATTGQISAADFTLKLEGNKGYSDFSTAGGAVRASTKVSNAFVNTVDGFKVRSWAFLGFSDSVYDQTNSTTATKKSKSGGFIFAASVDRNKAAHDVIGFQCHSGNGQQQITGFKSLVNTAANCYGFYAGGTAINYFNGPAVLAPSPTAAIGETGSSVGARINPDTGQGIFNRSQGSQNANPVLVVRRANGSSGAAWAGIRLNNHDNSVQTQIRLDGATTRAIDVRLGATSVAMPDGAANIIKLIQPKMITQSGETFAGFMPSELKSVYGSAVYGDDTDTVAIGTIANPDGTVFETDVEEPEAGTLTYEEEVEATPYIPADPDNEIEEAPPTYTTVTRTRTWTPTGTRPIYQEVADTKLIPLLTKALQEALDKIETLETRLSDAGIA